jgi:hypothetical protein
MTVHPVRRGAWVGVLVVALHALHVSAASQALQWAGEDVLNRRFVATDPKIKPDMSPPIAKCAHRSGACTAAAQRRAHPLPAADHAATRVDASRPRRMHARPCRWRLTVDGDTSATPVVSPDGIVYFPCFRGQLYAVRCGVGAGRRQTGRAPMRRTPSLARSLAGPGWAPWCPLPQPQPTAPYPLPAAGPPRARWSGRGACQTTWKQCPTARCRAPAPRWTWRAAC